MQIISHFFQLGLVTDFTDFEEMSLLLLLLNDYQINDAFLPSFAPSHKISCLKPEKIFLMSVTIPFVSPCVTCYPIMLSCASLHRHWIHSKSTGLPELYRSSPGVNW